jgi:DNA-binding MarR family transcriptional regulator
MRLSILSTDPPGFVLPLRLLAGFRVLVDRLHAELSEQGHPRLRPVHGFVLQAVGTEGCSAASLGRRLGVSKQAAGKHLETLERLGYVERVPDPADARSKLAQLSARGTESLTLSAAIFERLRAEWSAALGADRLRALEEDLATVAPGALLPLDIPGWFGGA